MSLVCVCFFFNDAATTEIYTLSLHDALPISNVNILQGNDTPIIRFAAPDVAGTGTIIGNAGAFPINRDQRDHQFVRSEEHTSELRSLAYLVCRLLLEKKKNNKMHTTHNTAYN